MPRFWPALMILCVSPSYGDVTLDESPAETRQWGYRPDDAEVVVDPPGFTWRPCSGGATYVLQIARDPAFANVVYERDAIPWSAHCPSKVLAQGAYYWRYAACDADGKRTDWSRTRSFRIKPGAVPFAQPGHDEFLSRMPKGHPRLFLRPEDVARFRQLAEGPLAERWQDLRKRADALVKSPPDTSEPPKYPEGVTRTAKPDEWRAIWWGNRRRVVAVADAAATLGFVYQVSGDEPYAHAARDLLLAMATWDADGSTEYRYNDEAAMPALYLPSRAYSWIHPVLADDERAAIAAMMRERGGQAFDHLRKSRHLWQPFESHRNRAWHFLGEVAIAFHGDFPEADTWLDYAMTVFYTAYPVWGDSDGGWHEGISYWSSYTARFMYWAYVVRAAFGIDVFERPFYHHVGDFGMYTLPPGSQAGGFGDLAATRRSEHIASLMAALANGARNPYWQWYADTCGGTLGDTYLGFIQAAGAAQILPSRQIVCRCVVEHHDDNPNGS